MKKNNKKNLIDSSDKINEVDAIVKSIKRRLKKHPEEKGLQKEKDRYYDKQLSYLKGNINHLTNFINGNEYGDE